MKFKQVNEVTSHKHFDIHLSRDCTRHENIECIKLRPGKEYKNNYASSEINSRQKINTNFFSRLLDLFSNMLMLFGTIAHSMNPTNTKNSK